MREDWEDWDKFAREGEVVVISKCQIYQHIIAWMLIVLILFVFIAILVTGYYNYTFFEEFYAACLDRFPFRLCFNEVNRTMEERNNIIIFPLKFLYE